MRTYDDLWDAVQTECKRLSRAELIRVAERADIPIVTLRAYLRGQNGAPYARVRALADILGARTSITILLPPGVAA